MQASFIYAYVVTCAYHLSIQYAYKSCCMSVSPEIDILISYTISPCPFHWASFSAFSSAGAGERLKDAWDSSVCYIVI